MNDVRDPTYCLDCGECGPTSADTPCLLRATQEQLRIAVEGLKEIVELAAESPDVVFIPIEQAHARILRELGET